MKQRTHADLRAAAAAVLCAAAPSFASTPADDSDLRTKLDAAMSKIAQMDAKIATLEAENDDAWMTEQRAAEIRGVVQDVLADADTRASLLQSGMTSGYDNGFILSSSDGNWLLKTNFLMQQRFIFNYQDDANSPGTDSTRYGFENTRSKFIMTGHVVNPDWFYRVDVNLGSNGGGGIPEDVRTGTLNSYLGYNFGAGLQMYMGSFKLPFLREELVESQYQQTVERSILGYGFTTGYTDGLAMQYQTDFLRFYGAYSDGFDQAHQQWDQPGPLGHAEYALTGRVEWKAAGEWQEFEQFTSPRGEEFGILLGGAAHFQKSEFGTFAGPEPDYLFLTADISVQFGGGNLFAYIVWNNIDDSPLAPVSNDYNPWGFLVQGGFYVDETWEIFARYEYGDTDNDFTSDQLSVITVGFNKYFSGQNVKWTTDFGLGLDPVVGAGQFNSLANITGWREDTGDNNGQFVIRTQWQLLF